MGTKLGKEKRQVNGAKPKKDRKPNKTKQTPYRTTWDNFDQGNDIVDDEQRRHTTSPDWKLKTNVYVNDPAPALPRSRPGWFSFHK